MDDRCFFRSRRSGSAPTTVFPAAPVERGGHGRERCCSGVLRFWVPPSHLHVAARRPSPAHQVAQPFGALLFHAITHFLEQNIARKPLERFGGRGGHDVSFPPK